MWSWWILEYETDNFFQTCLFFWVVWLRVLCCPVWVIAGAGDACDALCAQYQGSGVTTGKNADCAAISTLFVTICWPLWTPGQGEEVRRDAGSSRAGNRADNLSIRHHQPRPVVNNMSKTWGIMLYFISGPRPRILIIRICYHCCSTIISYDSCVKLCYGHNDQNVWIILHYVIWTDFITPNMEVRGPGQEPFV